MGKKKERRYMGMTAEDIRDVLFVLCGLVEDIGLTEQEMHAMDVAVEALNDIHNALVTGGKVRLK